jgi:hypothetical protein
MEIVAAMVGAYGEWESDKRPRGRQRKYADTAARRRAWNEERRKKPAVPSDETPARPRYDIHGDPDGRNMMISFQPRIEFSFQRP